MSLKGQMTPEIYQIFTWQLYQCTLNIGKKIEGRKRKLSTVRHQTCIVPSRNYEPSSELLWFVSGVCQNFRQTGQFSYHIILVAWHYINRGFIFSDLFFNFLELKCHGMPCMCPGRETNMFENSFEFSGHGINSHTSTQKYDFSNRYG